MIITFLFKYIGYLCLYLADNFDIFDKNGSWLFHPFRIGGDSSLCVFFFMISQKSTTFQFSDQYIFYTE